LDQCGIDKSIRHQDPIEIWFSKLRDKYVTATYYSHLLDNWQRFTQGTKSAKKQFDKFLVRYNALGTKSDTRVLSDLGMDFEKT